MPIPSRLRRLSAVLTLSAALTGVAAWGAAPAQAQGRTPAATAIRYALAQLGDPYSYGSNGPSSWDCSSLTQASYRAAGISTPRTSQTQYGFGRKVPVSRLQAGDLVFFASNTSDPSTIHHVAIYLGRGMMLAAPHTGDVVKIQKMYTTGRMPYGTRPAGTTAAPLLTVSPGDTGDAVRDVQTRLRANGYRISSDGDYGPATRGAVSSFQRAIGVTPDGIVGSGTWGLLVSSGRLTSRS